jgi:beta-lactamase class A
MIGRRTLLLGAPLLAVGCTRVRVGSGRTAAAVAAEAELRALCAGMGARNRLGVAAIDTANGSRIGYQQDARFAMASTFKAPLAGIILGEVEAGRIRLGDRLAYGEGDLTSYAPVARERLAQGGMSVETALAAIVQVSDNTAANLLLRRIGGPEGFTAQLRRIGDPVTRLDRWEEELNSNLPGDPRDTTTPAAMAATMQRLLTGDFLTAASRALLIGWMETSTTGLDRLRAGFPTGWRAGDKTGSGGRGATNDVAIAFPPGRAPLIVAAYLDAPGISMERRKAIHVEVGRVVARIAAG